jgi:hypothetical protein
MEQEHTNPPSLFVRVNERLARMGPYKLFFGAALVTAVVVLTVVSFIGVGNSTSGQDQTFDPQALETRFAWPVFEAESGLLSVKFPSTPQHSGGELPIADSRASLQQDVYAANDAAGNTFFASSFIYPVAFDTKDPQSVLKIALNGMVGAASGGKLIDSSPGTFKGQPSLQFTIEDARGTLYQGELFCKGRVLYQVFTVYESGNLDDAEYAYFLNSFMPKGI